MNVASADISVAIETSCRRGGVALARGDELLGVEAFDAGSRHAVQLVSRLDELLGRADLGPGDLRNVYVSAGPGSFTGLRIGITVARTLAQASPSLRCVAVPTHAAVADGARSLEWRHLAVVLDARGGTASGALFARRGGRIAHAGAAALGGPAELLAAWPRPLTVVGEAAQYCDFTGEGVSVVPPGSDLHLPTPESVWRVGRGMARAGQFTDFHRLLPVYSRPPHTTSR